METRANYVLIGVFTLLGLLGTFAFLLWLAKINIERQYAYYYILFDDVSGLTEAGAVRFNGLPVGQVVLLELDEEDSSKVRVRIEVDAGTPVKTDTVATLNSQGVTGVSFVGLTGGSKDAPLLDQDGVITSKRSALQSVFEGAPKLLDNAIDLLDDINDVFNDENRNAIGDILSNLSSASESVDSVLEDFKGLSSELGTAAQEVAGFTSRLEALSDTADTTLTTATETLQTAQGAITRAEGAVDAAIRTLDTANTTFETADRLIQGDLGDFIRQGTETADALQEAVIALEPPAVATLRAAEELATTRLPLLMDDLSRATTSVEQEITRISTSANDLIQRYDDVGASVKARVDQTKTAIEAFETATNSANQTLQSVTRTSEAANELIQNQGRVLVSQAQETLGSVKRVTDDDLPRLIDQTTTSIASVQTEIDETLEIVQNFATETLPPVAKSVDDFFIAGSLTLEKSDETLDSIYAAMDSAMETLDLADAAFAGITQIVETDVQPVVDEIKIAAISATDAINKASDAIDGISDNVLAASQSAASLVGTIETIVINNRRQVSDFLRLGLPQIQTFVEESRRLVSNLDRFVDRFERDPARFLLGTTSSEFRR